MPRKIAFILCIFFFVTLGFASQIHASVSSMSGDYVIFRANISPLYIENESVVIQVMAVPFQGNKPVGETSTVHITITGVNVLYHYSEDYSVGSGRYETLYLPALKEGHYDMTLYAEWHGIRSKLVDQDFGVTKAPVPYSLSFSDDGSVIYFTSLQLNSTGQPDPHFPFTLEIYEFVHGEGESLVITYKNITQITIHVPNEWKRGILYVEVVDCWGWHNSATIDLAKMQFQGIPVSYDYMYTQQEPFASRRPSYIIATAIAIIIVIVLLRWWWYRGD